MAAEQIEVSISPTGEVTIAVAGVGGNRCLATTADLERALGGAVVERRMTGDAYRDETAGQAEERTAWNRRSW